MKLILSILFFSFLQAQNISAQVQQYRAFVKVSSPGTQMVDDSGTPLNNFIVERFLILEIPAGQKPLLERVSSGKISFNFAAEKISGNRFDAGKLYSTEKPARIRMQKKNNQLWKISLTSKDGKAHEEILNNIIVSGKLNRKPFRLLIRKETQLAGDQNY